MHSKQFVKHGVCYYLNELVLHHIAHLPRRPNTHMQRIPGIMLALLYNFRSVYTNIPSCRRGESKTSFPLLEGIFVYSRVFVQ